MGLYRLPSTSTNFHIDFHQLALTSIYFHIHTLHRFPRASAQTSICFQIIHQLPCTNTCFHIDLHELQLRLYISTTFNSHPLTSICFHLLPYLLQPTSTNFDTDFHQLPWRPRPANVSTSTNFHEISHRLDVLPPASIDCARTSTHTSIYFR